MLPHFPFNKHIYSLYLFRMVPLRLSELVVNILHLNYFEVALVMLWLSICACVCFFDNIFLVVVCLCMCERARLWGLESFSQRMLIHSQIASECLTVWITGHFSVLQFYRPDMSWQVWLYAQLNITYNTGSEKEKGINANVMQCVWSSDLCRVCVRVITQ